MKLLIYIWRNVSRNKLRSILTVLSISFSLMLMTLLFGFLVMQDTWGIKAAKYHRIVVMNSQGFSGRLPISYVEKIQEMEGIKDAVPFSWFGGDYKTQKMPFSQFGTDADHVFNVWAEMDISPDQLKAWQADRRGCVADERLAERFKWKIGEKIPLEGEFMPVQLDLTLVGTFRGPLETDMLWFHWAYMDELLRQKSQEASGNAGTIWAKTIDDDMAIASAAIDEKFGSSENPTRTQTESAFAKMFADMMGDIRTYIRFIGLAVVFSLMLVAGNAMAMAMRERTTEIAVLKAIGFSKLRILLLVVGESVMIAVLGGVLGILSGCALVEFLHIALPQIMPFPITEFVGMWMVYLLSVAAGVGLVSGFVPAYQAAQLSVVNGLRRVI